MQLVFIDHANFDCILATAVTATRVHVSIERGGH